MTRKAYPSDLTEEQFQLIEPYLKSPAINGGRQYTYNTKDIIDALLYIKTNGCSWRAIPHDFNVPWPTVYYHFQKFKQNNTFEKITKKLNKLNRKKLGKKKAESINN